ncbi:MAG: AbrB/MazE/SpoVT family DNA-binding domain-containing protein [Nanoarchaeota archaeon]|nr:AbrB/MazE/SpoVT family DNA-binding domain-containing protein [Nanoarchaeota archaeon]
MIEAKVRKWGNSLGLIIPKETVEKEHIKEKEKLKFLIIRDSNVLKETFGMVKGKWKKSAQQIKDQARKELYND